MKKIFLCTAMVFVMVFNSITMNVSAESGNLNLPSYVTKIDGLYFIVDSYNNRIIYHDTLGAPIREWQVMVSGLGLPHTMASDGVVYLIDDTENHRVLVMVKRYFLGKPYFVKTKEFENIGNRPHYVVYHEPSATFYVWSSYTGEMYLFKRTGDGRSVHLVEVRNVPPLMGGVYVRSFTIIDDKIYFVSGNMSIIKADMRTFRVLETYPVPADISGMVQMTKIEDYFYITVAADVHGNQDFATIIRTENLSSLAEGDYEDIYSHFGGGGGTPYNMTNIDGLWYLTDHRVPGRNIFSFSINGNEIQNVKQVY